MQGRQTRSKHLRTSSSDHPVTQARGTIERDSRPANTVSMYAGIGKHKLPARQVAGFPKSSGSRRSESTHTVKPLHRSLIRYKKMEGAANDASFVGLNPMKQFKRQAVRGQLRANLLASDEPLRRYLQLAQKAEVQFMSHCREQREQEYAKSAEVIIRLLNYSVDYNLPDQFLRAIKLLADFYRITDRVGLAVFYYEQAREACLLLDSTAMLVEALLGLAGCCGKIGMETEGIRILKKALEYAWLKGLEQLQLRIYDEIGRMHYYLGDLRKAKQYHARHLSAMHEPSSSALLLLSRQRLLKAEELNLEIKYRDISRLLLVHLKLPLRTIEQIPLAPGELQAEPIRQFFDLPVRSQGGEDAGFLIRQILQSWFFEQQIEDPFLPQNDWNATRSKKFAFLDFQLNQQLKRLEGTGMQEKKKLGRTVFAVKESLEEQVSRKMKEPPLESDWYEKIVKQINRDHRNKLLNVRSPVRIRGFNKKTIPSAETLKDLFNALFERTRAPAPSNSSFLSRDQQ